MSKGLKIQDAMVQMLIQQPFYGYLAASVSVTECKDIKTIGLAVTPDPKLQYNREWFEGLKPEHAAGVLMHELLHLVLLHPFRRGTRERNLWTIACDMAVNENIDPELLNEDAVTVKKISEAYKENLLPKKSAEFYYKAISKDDGNISFLEQGGKLQAVLKNGAILTANNTMENNTSEIDRNTVMSMVTDIIEQSEAEGSVPAGLGGTISELYRSHRVNWRNVLKRFITGRGKVQARKSFKKESRRFEGLPGNKRVSGVDALLALDESGSISRTLTEKFCGELMALKRAAGASVRVTRFDTECTEPVSLERYVRNMERVKNGGTDFRPVFKLADELRVSLVIIFTDGDGPAPASVNQKVLWVLTGEGKKPADYGHSVLFDEKGGNAV